MQAEMIAKKRKTSETRTIESLLRQHSYKDVEAYRQNSVCIKVRVIDRRFAKLDRVRRDDLVNPILEELPERTRSDILILLLLSPDEVKSSMGNFEFDHPVVSSVE